MVKEAVICMGSFGYSDFSLSRNLFKTWPFRNPETSACLLDNLGILTFQQCQNRGCDVTIRWFIVFPIEVLMKIFRRKANFQ